MNEKQRYSPETGKPNPVSLREFMLMDRHEQRAFTKPLSQKEKYDFQLSVIHGMASMPLEEKRDIQKALVAKLASRAHMSLGDKIELTRETLYLKSIMLPKKEPILLRKLRAKPLPVLKLFGEAKSPFLIAPQR